jgi:group II intron reverse transcriptase/maturase
MWERIISRENLMAALRRVQSNGGVPGVDGMTAEELPEHLREHWPSIREKLEAGRYEPSPVKRVEIPKPGKGMRQLGIPTVQDRFIQQAMQQVLSPQFEPTFSEHSYGFRPGRSAHEAVKAAQTHVEAGYKWVVDIDMERFFDTVNHDRLMARMKAVVREKRVLRLVNAYLKAGVMVNGVVVEMKEGTPQGGPLTPPTMLQTAPFGAQIKRGGCHPEYDIDFLFADLNTFDQRPNEFTFGEPLGFGQATANLRGELL